MSTPQTPDISTCCPPRLGLWGPAAAMPAKQPRSLSIRTASGHCVSILNDEHPVCARAGSVASTAAGSDDSCCGYTHSDCGLRLSVPKAAAPLHSLRRTHSASGIGLQSPCATPTRLPSLSVLVQAAAASAPYAHHLALHLPPAAGLAAADCAPAVLRAAAKRRYACGFHGCGKAFTTSGHLSRHYRIHTGEKNYRCPYPGCTSRFSRQDNMMQHYRTHLSPRSRRNRGLHAVDHPAEYDGALALFPAASRSAFSPYARTFAPSPPPAHSQWPCF